MRDDKELLKQVLTSDLVLMEDDDSDGGASAAGADGSGAGDGSGSGSGGGNLGGVSEREQAHDDLLDVQKLLEIDEEGLNERQREDLGLDPRIR